MATTTETASDAGDPAAANDGVWKIDVTAPDGREITMSIDDSLLDLTSVDKATRIGTEVTGLIRGLLDA